MESLLKMVDFLKMEDINMYSFAYRFLWKPVYHVVHFYFMNVPKWAGGYSGLPDIDVCSMITGISTNILVRSNPELCEESIATFVNGYTTLLITISMTIFLVIFFREFVPMIRQVIPAYYSRLDKLKKEKATKERNQIAAAKRAETITFNSDIKTFSKTVITVLKSKSTDHNKISLLMDALQMLNSKTKDRLGESESTLLLENSEDLLMVK